MSKLSTSNTDVVIHIIVIPTIIITITIPILAAVAINTITMTRIAGDIATQDIGSMSIHPSDSALAFPSIRRAT